jgi:hypothetical protein
MHFTTPFAGIMEYWNDGILLFTPLFVNTFIGKRKKEEKGGR